MVFVDTLPKECIGKYYPYGQFWSIREGKERMLHTAFFVAPFHLQLDGVRIRADVDAQHSLHTQRMGRRPQKPLYLKCIS